MKPTQIAKLGVVALVIAAVAIVLRLKQADSPSTVDDPSGSISNMSNMVLDDRSGTTPPEPQPDAPDSARQGAAPTWTDSPAADVALPRLLDLGADKCIPCKKMAPILEALREDFSGQFNVVFIDVWKNRQAAGAYEIKLIPTQIFFDEEGHELFRHQGFFSREDILAAWSELGYTFGPSPERDAG